MCDERMGLMVVGFRVWYVDRCEVKEAEMGWDEMMCVENHGHMMREKLCAVIVFDV